MLKLDESDDVDDIQFSDDVLEQQKKELINKTPTNKKKEILKRFEDLLENFDDYGEEGIRLSMEQTREVIYFYNESHKALAKKFEKSTSPEIINLIKDTFSSACNLSSYSVSEINERKLNLENRFQQLLETKQEIENITQDSNVEKWFFRLVKDWKKERKNYKQIENELLTFLQKLQEEIKDDGKKRELISQKINVGILNESEKKKWNELINQKSGKELEKRVQKIEQQLEKREKKLPVLYEKNVTQNLENPLKAREELRKLRRKFGWGIFDFLNANELWQKLNTIHVLQKQKAKLKNDFEKNKEEKRSLILEWQQIERQLSELTGKASEDNVFGFHPETTKETEDEDSPIEQENNGLEVQIRSLEKVKKIIHDYWIPESLNATSVRKDKQNKGIELSEKPESYAWLSSNSKVNWLKKHQDSHGENLWKKYKRFEAICPYSTEKDHRINSEEFHPRYINIPLKRLNKDNAKDLESTVDTFMQGPKELFFLASVFTLDLEDDKLKYASAPAEVLSKIEFKLSELKAKNSTCKV